MTTTASRFSFGQVRDVLGSLLGPELRVRPAPKADDEAWQAFLAANPSALKEP